MKIKIYQTVAFITLALGLVIYASFTAAGNNDWPAFTMQYELLGAKKDKSFHSQEFQLIYSSKKSWRLEILRNSENPEFIGSWLEFALDEEKGETTEKFKNHVNQKEEIVKKVGNSYRTIDHNLNPQRITKLIRSHKDTITDLTPEELKRFSTITNGLPLKKVTIVEYRECFDYDQILSSQQGSPECKKQRNETEQIIYIDQEFVPVNIIQLMDGYKVYEMALKSIEFKKK